MPKAWKGWRRGLGLGLTALTLASCGLVPVSPLVMHQPYQVPYFAPEDFESLLNRWKQGQTVDWSFSLRATAFSDNWLVLRSSGSSSFGPQVVQTPTSGTAKSFTPTKAELSRAIDRINASKVFVLYDGRYAAYGFGGGTGGPELELKVGNLLKKVGKDEGLPTWMSWESAAIQEAADAVREVGLRYLR